MRNKLMGEECAQCARRLRCALPEPVCVLHAGYGRWGRLPVAPWTQRVRRTGGARWCLLRSPARSPSSSYSARWRSQPLVAFLLVCVTTRAAIPCSTQSHRLRLRCLRPGTESGRLSRPLPTRGLTGMPRRRRTGPSACKRLRVGRRTLPTSPGCVGPAPAPGDYVDPPVVTLAFPESPDDPIGPEWPRAAQEPSGDGSDEPSVEAPEDDDHDGDGPRASG